MDRNARNYLKNRTGKIADLTAILDTQIELIKEFAPKMETITLDQLEVIDTVTRTEIVELAPEPTPEPEVSRLTYWEVKIGSAIKAHYADRKAFRTAVRKMAEKLNLTYHLEDGIYYFFPEADVSIMLAFENDYDVILDSARTGDDE